MKQYLFNVALSLDLLGSALVGGIPGETLSGRAGTSAAQGKLKGKILSTLIDLLFWDKTHCATAVINDVKRAKAVIADDTRT